MMGHSLADRDISLRKATSSRTCAPLWQHICEMIRGVSLRLNSIVLSIPSLLRTDMAYH